MSMNISATDGEPAPEEPAILADLREGMQQISEGDDAGAFAEKLYASVGEKAAAERRAREDAEFEAHCAAVRAQLAAEQGDA